MTDRIIVVSLFVAGIFLTPLYVHAASLSVSPTSVAANGSVTLSWSSVTSPTVGDWIGLYNAGEPTNSNYLDYVYASSCTGGSAQSSGSCPFTINQSSGSYEFRYLPNNGYTSIASSQTVTVGASDTTAPTVPTGLAGTVISSSQINLTWTASTDAVGVTGYKIYRNGTQIGTSAGTSYSSTGLSPSTTYSYTVSAYDAAGNNSAQSSSISKTTPAAPDTTAPTVPTNLAASAISSSQINLSWTASTDAVGVTGYKVYRGGTQIATVTSGTSYSNTGLSPSTTYSYTVSAYDAAGNNSAQSSSKSATTLASGSSAWVGPTQTAPSGNKTLPLNIGGASQVKAGGLWAASIGSDSGYCIGASCITSWPTSQLTTNGTSVYYNSGNFGIGTTSPGTIFSLGGIANLSSAKSSFLSSGGINIKSGCFAVNGVCVGSSWWTKSGSDIYNNNTGFVGIGVSVPVATLDVAGIARLAPQSAAPATCNASRKGAIAISNTSSRFCVCDGSSWKFDYNGAACTW